MIVKLETDPERSALMKRVRRNGTAAEASVAKILRSLGMGYRRNVKSLPGSPDFANKARRWAVFVNGCFWHRHKGCFRATTPSRNRAFWMEKFETNRKRDARKIRELRRLGLCVVVVWECQTEDEATLAARLRRFSPTIRETATCRSR